MLGWSNGLSCAHVHDAAACCVRWQKLLRFTCTWHQRQPFQARSTGFHWSASGDQPRANRFTSHLGRWRRFVSCLALRLRFCVAHKMKINWPGVRTHSTPAFWLHTSAACPGAVLAPQGAQRSNMLHSRSNCAPGGARSRLVRVAALTGRSTSRQQPRQARFVATCASSESSGAFEASLQRNPFAWLHGHNFCIGACHAWHDRLL